MSSPTLPAAWYADADHYAREQHKVFENGWSCVGIADLVAQPNTYFTALVGGVTPVVITCDSAGELAGFINVCRHRGAPVASGCGSARALSCPYHAWVYRLDGSLSRARGFDHDPDFDSSQHNLVPVAVAVWARFVFVNLLPDASPLDLGPLATAIEPYPLTEMNLVATDEHDGEFNWKVFVENYSENFHTPLVHPDLIVNGWEYPILCEGMISLAWDRPLRPTNAVEQALADATPGDPRWSGVASVQVDDAFIAGSYFTVFPNLLVSMFPRYGHAIHVQPTSPRTTKLTVFRFAHASVTPERLAVDLAASREVAQQDLDICALVQQGFNAGIDTNGVVSAEHEPGVIHVHEILRRSCRETAAATD